MHTQQTRPTPAYTRVKQKEKSKEKSKQGKHTKSSSSDQPTLKKLCSSVDLPSTPERGQTSPFIGSTDVNVGTCHQGVCKASFELIESTYAKLITPMNPGY